MDIFALYTVFNLVLQIDLTCIACNWDPATGTWVPAAGAFGAAGAYGSGLGLNDLFGPFYDSPSLPSDYPDPTNPNSYPGATSQPSEPVTPYSNTSMDDRVAADEAARQRAADHYRATHPDATTAPPPQPTYEEQAADFFHTTVVEGIKRQ